MKTQIIKLENDWKDVKNVSRTTVNKKHSEIEATEEFKRKLLISEHSPIRLLKVRWRWDEIKSFVATHFSRHRWECFIGTQRDDRVGVNTNFNSRDVLVPFEGEANAQHLIDTSRKRLCKQSHPDTVEYMEDLKMELFEQDFEMASVLVPNCIYRNGCPEFECCGYHQELIKKDKNVVSLNIQVRYDAYNKIFIESKIDDYPIELAIFETETNKEAQYSGYERIKFTTTELIKTNKTLYFPTITNYLYGKYKVYVFFNNVKIDEINISCGSYQLSEDDVVSLNIDGNFKRVYLKKWSKIIKEMEE